MPVRAIGWMLGITSAGGALDPLPALVDALQEVEIFRRVDGRDRPQAVISAAAATIDAGGARASEQPLDPFRLFRIGLRRAARQEEFRIVALLFLGVEGFHGASVSLAAKASKASP